VSHGVPVYSSAYAGTKLMLRLYCIRYQAVLFKALLVNYLPKLVIDGALVGIWTYDLQSQVQWPNHFTIKPHFFLRGGAKPVRYNV